MFGDVQQRLTLRFFSLKIIQMNNFYNKKVANIHVAFVIYI